MKMMRSTSTTSMSGVTLMSELSPPPPPTAIAMTKPPLDPLFLLLADEADLLEPRFLHFQHRLLDVPVGKTRIALDHNRGILVSKKLLREAAGELRVVHRGFRLNEPPPRQIGRAHV